MATFRKRNNKWQARIQMSGGPSQARTFHTLQDAKQWARYTETCYQQGAYLQKPKTITLYQAFSRYLTEVNPRKKRGQIERYRILAWMQHQISALKIDQVRTYHLATWRDEKIQQGFQPNTIRLHLAVLSHLYTIAVSEWGYEYVRNPVLGLARPKINLKMIKRISDADVELWIKHTASIYLPTLIRLALTTGMRRSELIKLTWEDIDWVEQSIYVRNPKNGEDRVIPLFQKTRQVLEDFGVTTGKIFPITENAVTLAFNRTLRRVGQFNINFHGLRHEAITRFFEMGLSIPEVASISGHKSWSMLRRYTHLDAKSLIAKIDVSKSIIPS